MPEVPMPIRDLVAAGGLEAGSEPLHGRERVAQTQTAAKLTPLGDRVVIRPTEREEMTKSGLLLPDTAKEKPQEGEVIAVGPGRVLDNGTRLAVELKTGEKVLYAKYAGTEFKLEDEELLILREADILAIVTE
ncbi:MAG: chaperonin GroES [Chloroflexota bacterium]|jgi:chaperonin GroES|nr:chaperonin GroES [Chloroflexota bacterium]